MSVCDVEDHAVNVCVCGVSVVRGASKNNNALSRCSAELLTCSTHVYTAIQENSLTVGAPFEVLLHD
jgi:hypothetical protein